MAYRWSIQDIINHKEHISYEGHAKEPECMVCNDIDSVLEMLEITGQKYVYLRAESEY